MSSSPQYQDLAQAYSAGVRELLAAPRIVEADAPTRAGRTDDLASRATLLAPVSVGLTRAAAAQLEDPDPQVRAEAETRLLAKALADLEVSRYLFDTAEMLEGAGPAADQQQDETRGLELSPLEESLNILLGAPGSTTRGLERDVIAVTDVPSAREQLTRLAQEALQTILSRAAKTGQGAVAGLVGLGLADVAQAAGFVGADLAQALGVAERASRIYTLVREFALNAYNALMALMGPALAQMAATQVVQWVQDVTQGEEFARLLEKLYETGATRADIEKLVSASQAELTAYAAAIESVDGLNSKYAPQIGVIEKIMRGLQLLGMAAALAMPQVRLFLAAAYVITTAYVVLAGADFVDARHMRLLDRVPGVRQVVEKNLAAA